MARLTTAIFSNDTQSDITSKSTITTSVSVSNSSTPISFTRPPLGSLSAGHQALLSNLTIANGTFEFLTAYYWALNYDLGQISRQNIFGNPDLLADATDIFHDNVFINDTFQDTPLSDGRIPGDGYRQLRARTGPIVQSPAVFDQMYNCWRWVPKPFLLRLIDVLVSTAVLFILILFVIYLILYCFLSTVNWKRGILLSDLSKN